MSDVANAEQSDFWNTEPGQRWVRHQADLDALHEGPTGVLLGAARPREGERVLDVGCGAGASSFAVARAVGPGGEVLGIDISRPLVMRAEERRAELGIANVRFRHGDAQADAIGSEEFDLAVSRFGVMFFDTPVVAFGNVRAALRPGGRIAFVAWQGLEQNPWFRVPQALAEARLGKVPAAPEDAPGPMAFRDADRVCRLMAEAGFAACASELVATELHHPGGAEAAAAVATEIGPVSRTIREKGGTEEDRAALRQQLLAAFEAYRSADGIRVPAGVIVYTGRKE